MAYTRQKEYIIAFGKHLKKLRQEKGLTQEQLAFASDLEHSQISRIERGVINTSISQLYQIAKALEVPVKKLFDFDSRDL